MPAFITITARLARPPEVRETNSGLEIGTAATQKVGFFGTAPAVQQTHDSEIAITYTANDPSIADSNAITIADGSTPTVAELLEFCEKLNNRVAELHTKLETLGLMASS